MFHELSEPKRPLTLAGYYVYTVNDNPELFLRRDGSGLDDGYGDIHDYLFNSVADAHEAGIAYYSIYNETYPHIAVRPVPVPSVESQVMRFK